MRGRGGEARSRLGPPLPRSIWVLAWTSLAGQVALVARTGWKGDDEVSVVVSMALGALLVGYVSAGVVRGRPVRVALVWVVLVLVLLTEGAAVLLASSAEELLRAAVLLVLAAVQVAALWRFSRSDWYRWQRTRPPTHEGAPIGQLVSIAVLVGLLGGLAGPVDHDGLDLRVRAEGGR